MSKTNVSIDLDELEGGDGRKPLEVGIVEWAGRVRGVATGDAVDDALRGSCPVGSGESEAVVGAGVQRIYLLNDKIIIIWHKRIR